MAKAQRYKWRAILARIPERDLIWKSYDIFNNLFLSIELGLPEKIKPIIKLHYPIVAKHDWSDQSINYGWQRHCYDVVVTCRWIALILHFWCTSEYSSIFILNTTKKYYITVSTYRKIILFPKIIPVCKILYFQPLKSRFF